MGVLRIAGARLTVGATVRVCLYRTVAHIILISYKEKILWLAKNPAVSHLQKLGFSSCPAHAQATSLVGEEPPTFGQNISQRSAGIQPDPRALCYSVSCGGHT